MTNNKMISVGVLLGGIGMLILSICVLVWGATAIQESKDNVKLMEEFVAEAKELNAINASYLAEKYKGSITKP